MRDRHRAVMHLCYPNLSPNPTNYSIVLSDFLRILLCSYKYVLTDTEQVNVKLIRECSPDCGQQSKHDVIMPIASPNSC